MQPHRENRKGARKKRRWKSSLSTVYKSHTNSAVCAGFCFSMRYAARFFSVCIHHSWTTFFLLVGPELNNQVIVFLNCGPQYIVLESVAIPVVDSTPELCNELQWICSGNNGRSEFVCLWARREAELGDLLAEQDLHYESNREEVDYSDRCKIAWITLAQHVLQFNHFVSSVGMQSSYIIHEGNWCNNMGLELRSRNPLEILTKPALLESSTCSSDVKD